MLGLTRTRFVRGAVRPRRPRPPWAIAESEFITRCTRCGACAQACSPGIVVPGAGGFPEVDFERGGCLFCGECARVCSPHALRIVAGGPPWRLRAAVAAVCLGARGVVCGSCVDACDTQAIVLRTHAGGAGMPQVDGHGCTGCGACMSVCPASAIVVREPAVTGAPV